MTPTDPIRINDKEYAFADLPEYAQKMIHYITGIDAQLDKAATQMEQLEICREGCYTRLNQQMEKYDGEEKAGIPEENPADA